MTHALPRPAPWSLLDHLVVRTTGFPYEAVEELRLPASAEAIDAVLAAERAAGEHRATLLRDTFPAAVRAAAGDKAAGRLLSRQRAAVGRFRPVAVPEAYGAAVPTEALTEALTEWNRLLAVTAELAERAEAAHPAELALCGERLRAVAADPRLQDAILLLSPAFHDSLRKYAAGSAKDARQVERRLAAYLQRLAAKNETNSHYGPVNHGRLDPGLTAPLRVVRDPSRVTRTVFAAARLADALTAAVHADPRMRPHLRPRRSVAFQVADGRATHTGTGRAVALSPEDVRLIEAADGTRGVAELAADLGEPWTSVAARVAALVHRRLLVFAPPAAPDTAYPLAAVAGWLASCPQAVDDDADQAVKEWSSTAQELTGLVAACAAEPRTTAMTALRRLEERYEELSGEAARRGGGTMYADRTLVFEECRGDLARFELGGGTARRVGDDLVPVIELWRTAALLRSHDQRRQARRVLDALTPRGDVPLLRYLRSATAAVPDGGPVGGPVDGTVGGTEDTALAGFGRALRGLLDGHGDAPHVELAPERLAAVSAGALAAIDDVSHPSFTSVDLMLAADGPEAAAEGRFRLVVGEGHAPALLSVFPTDHFRRESGDPDRVAALLAKVFADAGVRVGQVLIGRGTKIFPYRLADTLIELRPHLPGPGGVPAAALRVRADGHGVALYDDDGPLLLHPQLRRAPGFDPFAPFTLPAVEDHPVTLPEHTPRITVGGVVYQRERWRVPGLPWDAGLGGWGLLRAAREWRARSGMPEQVYYRTPEEPKPLLLDFTSRHLVELFHRHVARGAGPVTVSEMLPAPDDLWLTGPDGRHTMELRAFAVHPGGAGATGWRLHRG
ncbi:hypothetical protein GCM10009677_04270 [Sphaerisporangium rubeum]|uniref:Lantibiotic dehydratase n=1 Tax=Sphaerisporangium rubeum TaxID=321317 RepID=A0A7X0I8T8_9ACTN|nr:hypothetical protein [Sphaerisporangium rubeum]MBB6470730.1 hypothetical protein [Sphaerisporangium rubeum]